jgi:hypothetical protein
MENQVQKQKVDFSYYLGKWVNTYDKARIIRGFTLSESDGKLKITVDGSAKGYYPGDWGTSPVQHFAYAPDMNDIVAFQSEFDLKDFHALLSINENKGLLVIAGSFTFKNSDLGSDFFVREFFYKV